MYIDYLSNSRTNGMNTGREYLTMEELAAIIKREFDSSRLEKSATCTCSPAIPVWFIKTSRTCSHTTSLRQRTVHAGYQSADRCTAVRGKSPYWKTPVKSSTSTKTMEQRIFCPFRASKRSTPT